MINPNYEINLLKKSAQFKLLSNVMLDDVICNVKYQR